MPQTLDITEFRRVNDLVSWMFRGTGDRLIVVFSGIGKANEDVQPYEFARSAVGDGTRSVLYISDTGRSWLNRPGIMDDIAALVDEAKARADAARVSTLGHSMGGFSAAVMAGKLGADHAICLSPQNSIHPDVAGDDARWQVFRDRITDVPVRDVASHLSDTPIYTVLFGRHGREAPQRDRFPIRENIDLFVMKNTVHNTPMRLKKAGLLADFITAATHGRRRKVRQIMLDHFGCRPVRDRAPLPPSIEMSALPARAAV